LTAPPDPGGAVFPMQPDWSEYLRVHADRRNLLMHLFAVPLFVFSGRWLQQYRRLEKKSVYES
jgi:uncharacterized membrane protein YGL010W